MNDAPLILVPGRQGRWRRGLFAVLTLAGWAIWLALWTPLWDVFGWLAGGRWPAETIHMTWSSVEWLTLIPLVCALVLGAWARYNYARFAHLKRRQGNIQSVSVAEAATALDAPEAMGHQMQAHQSMRVHFDERSGFPAFVESAEANPASSRPG